MSEASYFSDEFWDKGADARTNSLPLMSGGPWTLVSIIVLYLAFVKWLGPLFMAKREPMKMRKFMIVYSSLLSVGNGIGFLVGITAANLGIDAFACKSAHSSSPSVATFQEKVYVYGGWLYFISKLIDLVDTVIFVLRKSYRQVSGLHIFHHSFMPLAVWTGVKYIPGGNIVIIPLINTLIHSIMYAYYGMTAAGRNVWWKQYLTLMQVIQFIIFGIHSIYTATRPNCSYSMVYNIAELFYAAVFFVLFANFYRRTYLAPKSKCNTESNSTSTTTTSSPTSSGGNNSTSILRRMQRELNNNIKLTKLS